MDRRRLLIERLETHLKGAASLPDFSASSALWAKCAWALCKMLRNKSILALMTREFLRKMYELRTAKSRIATSTCFSGTFTKQKQAKCVGDFGGSSPVDMPLL
jgi:hypothetical protein